jgi:hypothetical protein
MEHAKERRILDYVFIFLLGLIAFVLTVRCSLPDQDAGWKENRDARFGYGASVPSDLEISQPPATGQASTSASAN